MRPKTLAALLLAALCSVLSLAHAQPILEIPVRIVFRNALGDAVQSDQHGAYETIPPTKPNQPYVRARIFTGSGDLELSVYGTNRSLMMDLTQQLWGLCDTWDPIQTIPPTGFPTQQRLYVNNVLAVTGTEPRGALIGYPDGSDGGYGQVRLGGSWDGKLCSTEVWVKRANANKWEIESKSPEGAPAIGMINQVFPRNLGLPRQRPVRYVNLPFQITVTVPQSQ